MGEVGASEEKAVEYFRSARNFPLNIVFIFNPVSSVSFLSVLNDRNSFDCGARWASPSLASCYTISQHYTTDKLLEMWTPVFTSKQVVHQTDFRVR